MTITNGMLVEQTSKKANIVIDMSSLDLFLLCHFRYYCRYILNRTLPMQFKSSALDKGGLMHEGFEQYYKGLAAGNHFLDNVNAATLRINALAADPNISNQNPEETNLLINTIQQNLEFWRHEDEMLEILAVEEPFAYVLYEDDDVRIIISGKIDLLVNKPASPGSRGSDYKRLPFDHKTYSRDGIVSRLSNQFQNYCSAVESNYIIINRVGLQKTLKPEEKFKRLPLSYDPAMLQQFRDNITKVILEEYLNCMAEKSWTMNFTSCAKFNRLCEYYDVCDSTGEDAKIFKLNNNYVEGEVWDVTKKLGRDEE